MNRDAYAPVLERRGFHDVSGYTLLCASISHPDRAGTADEWRSVRFLVQKICSGSQYPSCIFIQENMLVIVRQHFPVQEAQRLAETLSSAVMENISQPAGVHVGYFRCRSWIRRDTYRLAPGAVRNEAGGYEESRGHALP